MRDGSRRKPDKWIRRLILALLLALAITGGTLIYKETLKHRFDVTVYAPTCEDGGFSQYKRASDGAILIKDELPALGHAYGEWMDDTKAGTRRRICSVCGFADEEALVSELDILPQLRFNGSMEGVSKTDIVALNAQFSGLENDFSCLAFVTTQGHSTIDLNKHNYTVRFYDDPDMVLKHRVTFFGDRDEHKYILKACYFDTTMCRNLVSANIWRDMAADRPNLPESIQQLPTLGAVQGFPVTVWMNDAFFGLYTLNLHKDNDLFSMHDNAYHAAMICNAQTTDESLFKAEAGFIEDKSDWEVEYCGTRDQTWAKESFNRLIAFINTSDDETFKDRLGEQLDIDGAIDYLLFIYALGIPNNASKDLVMLNYGDLWIPSAYDMEEALGLRKNGEGAIPATDFLPKKVNGIWNSGTDNLLWDRLLQNFEDRILTRYEELRTGLLSERALTERVNLFISSIPSSVYELDAELYPRKALPFEDAKTQILNYIDDRLPLLDSALKGE